MTVVELKQFGMGLSGRPYGKKIYSVIKEKFTPPYQMDFSGVLSLGSSFGDEVIARLAKEQSGKMQVLNANNVIKKCLQDIAREDNVIFEYL